LIEVHTRQEVEAAVAAGARIIGVNNRNLHTLEVNVETSLELIELIPDECIAVSESGLRSGQDLARLRAAGFDAFLIGEHFMREADPGAALGRLLAAGE
jgi:indole-3-glycerol phosphate synthase